jgi:hypothetical protein
MQDQPTTVVQTVACDLGRCGSCRGVVLSMTDGHLTDCQHDCHQPDPLVTAVNAAVRGRPIVGGSQ